MADVFFSPPFRRLLFGAPLLPGGLATPFDWIETPSSHLFKLNVPGFGKDEIKVQLEEGNVLHIRGESSAATREEQPSKDAVWHLAERPKGEFSRRLELPENVRTEQIRAQVVNGVLTIVVPKESLPAKPKPRTITVSSKL